MTPRLANLVAVALLGAACVACVACCWGSPDESLREVMSRAARPAACASPGCDACEATRAWFRDNPGRRPGELLDAVEDGGPVVLETIPPGASTSGLPGPSGD